MPFLVGLIPVLIGMSGEKSKCIKSSSVAFRLGGTNARTLVSLFFLLLLPSTKHRVRKGMRTIRESQRPVQGILSGGKVQRLPDGIDPVNLGVMEPEQRVPWRGEEIVVDA